jgi:hypothetical protein
MLWPFSILIDMSPRMTMPNNLPTEEILLPASPPPQSEGWRRQEVQLKYRFGGRQIFSMQRAGIVHKRYPYLADPQLGTQYPGDVMRSHGVQLALLPDCLLTDEGTSDLTRVGGGVRYIPNRHVSHSFAVEGEFSDFLNETMSKKSRSTIERKIRRCAREFGGKLSVTEYRTEEEIAQFYLLAGQVSERSYQERLLQIGLPETDEFKQQIMASAKSNTVRGYVLFGEGRPLAYLYLPIVEGTVMVYEYMGYDPEFRKLSTGAVLQHLAFQKIFASKCTKYFDFMPGDGTHKALYGNIKATRGDVYFLGPKLANALYVSTHRFTDWAHQRVTGTLERAGVKGLLKKRSRELTIPKPSS